MSDELLTVKEVEEKLKVTRQAVSLWIKSKKLKAYKVGKFWRIRISDLNNFIENNCSIEKN